MKTENEIQQAGEKLFPNWFTEYDEGRAFRGFEAGVKWIQEQDNWISVNKMLPKEKINILVIDKNNKIGILYFIPKLGIHQMFTHWQPLPNPPKK